jgi:hypothetical protein
VLDTAAQAIEHHWSYTFIRTDLPIAQQGIQAGHAAWECGRKSQFDGHPSLIYFEARDQKHLLECQQYAESHGLRTFPFFEPYQDWGLTAFAIEPIPQDLRALFKQFKLWRK